MAPSRHRRGEERDDRPPDDWNPTPDELLAHLERNPRYLGPGWVQETLVVLAGAHRRDDL